MGPDTKPAPWYAGFKLIAGRGKGLLKDIFVFSVFVNILMLTGPIFMLQVYDRVLSSRSVPTLLGLVVLVIALYFIMGLVDFTRTRMLSLMGRRRVAFYEPYIFGAQVDPKFWTMMPRNSKSFRQLEIFGNIFQSAALLGYFDVFWIPIYLGVIYYFHPILGVAALCAVLLLVVLTFFQQSSTKQKEKDVLAINQRAFDFANEAVEGREVLAAQAMGASFQRNWISQRDEAAVIQNATSRVTGFYTSVSKTLQMLIQSMMLALGAYLVIQGELSPGAIIAGSVLLGRTLAPIQSIIGQWSGVQASANAMAFLETMVTKQPKQVEQLEYAGLTANLELNGLTVVDDKRKFIINQISARLPAGQALGIIGLSGSGKSTVAKAILGLVPLAAGEVKLGGVNRTQMSPEFFGKKIGYLPQEVRLFSGTIAQNIARMNENYKDEDVIAAAKAANVHDLILTLSDGYNTVISAAMNTLSGGQRQRIALARALYGDPLLLVLDEPNSALDDAGSKALNAAIVKLKQRGGSAVIMTHRPSAIEATEQLLIIENGRTKTYGPRDEVLKSTVKNADAIAKNITKKAKS